MYRLFRILIVFVIVFAIAAPVFAQDGAPAPISPETFLSGLFRLVNDLTYMPTTGVGVILLTSTVSLILFKFGVELSGNVRFLLALSIQVVVWVAYTLSSRAGLEVQFMQWYEAVEPLLRALLPFIGSFALGHAGYEYFKANGYPVLGFSPSLQDGSKAQRETVLELDRSERGN